MLSIEEINLLKAQNEGLKKQNQELQKTIRQYKQKKDSLKIILDSINNQKTNGKESPISLGYDQGRIDMIKIILN